MASRTVFIGADHSPCLIHEECAIPTVSEGQILAKIRLATICGSDLHTIAGKRREALPSVLGHEAVAEVVECRRADCDLSPGDRITFSIINSCDQCPMCYTDLPQKCQKLKKVGHSSLEEGSGFSGCYASHIILDKGIAIFKIEDNVPDRLVAPINCALATMVNAVSSIPPEKAWYQTALIQGAGLLGVYACALLHDRGFQQVYCTDQDHHRLMLTSQFGATPVFPGVCTDLPEENGVDVVIEACGAAAVVSEGVRYLRPGGMYLLVGMVHPDTTLDITGEDIIKKCLTIKGIHNYAPKHLEAAVEFVSRTRGTYPYEALLSPHYSLSDLPKALQVAREQKYHRVAVMP